LESGENVMLSVASAGGRNKKNLRLFGNMDVTHPTGVTDMPTGRR